MQIVDLRIMRGPNYWSVKHPYIIILKLRLGEWQDINTSQISGFGERLEKMFPEMAGHRSGEGVKKGFFEMVQTGISLGQLVEYLALELQPDCPDGRILLSAARARGRPFY
jgi:cyanophycin synthetase